MTKLYMKGSSILGRVFFIEASPGDINSIKVGRRGAVLE